MRCKPRSVLCQTLCLFTTLLLTVGTTANACSVPVFRYALERWRSDPYPVLVFHRGPLTDAQQAQIAILEPAGLAGDLFSNVSVERVDLETLPADTPKGRFLHQLWKQQNSPTLPHVVVNYPIPNTFPVWSGPLADFGKERARQLLDSPRRREIADRILKGGTGVFLLLESGKPEQDKAAAEIIKRELAKLEKSLKLPELDQQDIDNGLISVDPESLSISFSMLTVSRDDPAEQLLIRMLMGCDPLIGDLREYKDEPMVFPVFGRGRVLYTLVGKGINTENMAEACGHLVQSCTCEIKEQNPGMDLLMSIDWDNLIDFTETKEQVLPPLAGLSQFQAADASQPKADQTGTADDSGTADAQAADASTDANPASGQVAAAVPTVATAPPTTPRDSMSPASLSNNLLTIGGISLLLVFVASLLIIVRRG